MYMFRRGSCFTWFLLGLISALIACRVGHAQDDGVVLRMQSLPSPVATDIGAQVSRQIVRAFGEEYPQYRLEPFLFPGLQGMAMDQGPLMSIAVGMPPHGIYVNYRQSSTYINHGFLVPLEVLLARLQSANPLVREVDDQGNWLADPSQSEMASALEQIRARVLDVTWPVIYRRADTDRVGLPEGEHVWAMPYQNAARAMLYRRDVFHEAGLNPDRPPRDWDEFLAYCRAIRALPGKFGFVVRTGRGASWANYSFMVSNGVRYMEQDANGRWRAAFHTRAAAEAIYFLLRLTREPFETEDGRILTGAAFAPMGGVGSRDLIWERGDIGMMFTYMSFDEGFDINPALVGFARMPDSPLGRGAGEVNSLMLGVFSGATPLEQLGVMRYIWFLTGERAAQIRTRMFVDAGYGTYLNPDDLKRFGYEDVIEQIPPAWLETVEESFRSGVPEPYGRNTQMIYEYVSEPINWALERPALLELPKEQALDRIMVELDRAAARVDTFMLGELGPEEWRARRIAGGTVLLLIIAIFTSTIVWVWRTFSKQDAKVDQHPALHKRRFAYALILPGLAILFFVAYLPLILGIPLALFDYQLVLESRFVGLDQFATILYDARFWASMMRTFYYVLLVIGLGFWPPILVAILLDEVPGTHLKYFFRTVFYLPTIVSGIIMVFLWRQFYMPNETGVLNQILMSVNRLGPVSGTIVKIMLLSCWLSLVGFLLASAYRLKELSLFVRVVVGLFGLALLGVTFWPLVRAYIGPDELIITARGLDPALVRGWPALRAYLAGLLGPFQVRPLGWTSDPGMAMVSVVIPMVWASAGPGCIIYLAALKTVPDDLVEAAAIDGAGIMQRICYITLPRIKFLILIQLMGAAIGAFKGGTDFIMVMTGGGPQGATRTMGIDIFQRAWMELNFSGGAAMGWVLGALVIVITCFHLRRMSRASFTTAGQLENNRDGGA